MSGGQCPEMLQVDTAINRPSSGILGGRGKSTRRPMVPGTSIVRRSLWIVPDLWKTQRTRFPRGRWTRRTRPHAPQGHTHRLVS